MHDLATVLLHLLQSSRVLADDRLLVNRGLVPGPRLGLMNVAMLMIFAPMSAGASTTSGLDRLRHLPSLLVQCPRLHQPRAKPLVLALEVLKRPCPHRVDPPQPVGLFARLENGPFILVLEPADQGPGRRKMALGLLLLEGGYDAEPQAAVVETRTVGLWYEVWDSLLDDHLSGANIFHDEEVGIVPPVNQRNQFLDFSDGAALLFMNRTDLRLDGLFEKEEW